MMNNFESIKEEFYKTGEEHRVLSNKKYVIQKQYYEMLREKCKDNIGRCFKIGNKYCMVTDIDKIHYNRHNVSFNEFLGIGFSFIYPYNNLILPFEEDEIHLGNYELRKMLSGVDREEVSKEEFLEKFNEVNQLWIEKMNSKW